MKLVAAALGLLVVLALAAVALGGYWVLHTESGSAWLWERLRAAVPGELSAAAFTGTFRGGAGLRTLAWANPSLEVTASRVSLAIDPGLFPPSLTIGMLGAEDVEVRMRAAPEPDRRGPPFSPESLGLPLEIRVQALDLERLRILGTQGETLFSLRRAELAGTWHEAIVLSHLELDSRAGAIRGSAALGLRAPFEASASLEARYPFASGGDVVPIAFSAAFAGDLSNLRVRLDGSTPELGIDGRLFELLEAPRWELDLQSPRLQWPLRGAEPVVALEDVVLAFRGSAGDYALSGRGDVAALVPQASRFSFEATGDTAGIEVSRLLLEGPWLAAEAQGALHWRGGFGFRADGDVERFDPAALTAEWPAGLPVHGRASVAFQPGKLELEAVHAELAGTEQVLDAQGLVDLDAGVVDLGVRWSGLRWPVAGDTWRFRSASGDVAVTGRPDDWTLAGRIGLETPGLPPGTFELAGNGSREAATLAIEDSRVLGGTLAGRVHYSLPEGGRFSADLEAAGIDPGALAAAWPGRVSAKFRANGRLEPLEVAVDIERLSGTLRSRPLEGSGGLRLARGNLAVQDLVLASGAARLTADGSLRAEEGLDFALDVPGLDALLAGATGALHGKGSLSLAGDFPRADLSFEARALAWRDWRLASLDVEATQGAEPLVLTVEGRELELGALEAARFSAELAASERRQRLEAAATTEQGRLEVMLDGRLGDWRRPLASGWTGRLDALALTLAGGPQYALEAPAGLNLARERLKLERACLQGDPAGRVCVAGMHAGSGDFRLAADIDDLPADLARLLLQTDLRFTQTLDGSLSVRSAPGRRMSADARIDIAPGRVHNPRNPGLAVSTRAGTFRLDLDQGRVLLARLNLPVGEAALIDAGFSVDDVGRGGDSPISGRVAVNVYDIGLVAALVPSISRAAGHLRVDLAIDGTLAAPAVEGQASLANGGLSYAPLGLEVRDVQLTGRIGQGNRIDLQSSFRAGEGTGRLYSSTNGLGAAGDQLELRLTGDNLTVIDLPQVDVVADMDIGVGVTPERLVLDGEVRIPSARLSPREIASARVTESKDVVIVASRGEEEEATDPPPPVEVHGRVDLTLGEDVVIDFDAAETRLAGSVAFTWNGPPMPTANGEYKVEGRFEAYGQLLEITEGSVRFPSVPANNPQLRIRAEREIFGNPRIRTAGVLVSGMAQDPELEVYTVPPTNRERALTLLVTGSDFDYEQGVGAVDVGTYIAPDLYLSYGIGLFDRENVISVRYDLARGFGIKASSGKSTEGVDLSYTFER